MDPISQGIVGASAALAFARPKQFRLAAILGAAGGMLADADVLIRSSSDPLLNIEYHRHFSHALIFIPIGGLLATLLLYPLLRKRLSLAKIYLYATLGYATAGLLDACTSYGTQLLWPFSDYRVSWSIISIVDPLFTLPLLALAGVAAARRSPKIVHLATGFALAYLAVGFTQNRRAQNLLQELIEERQHHGATAATVKPSIANLILWRSIYRYEDRFYVDAVRPAFFSEPKTYPGTHLPAFDIEPVLRSLEADDPIADDLLRFDHFSEGYLAALPDEPRFITDLRYSAIPNSIEPLWGIDLSKTNDSGHASFETRRAISESQRESFVKMLTGN